LRRQTRPGITNGVALIIVILVVALPSTAYYLYFNKPLTVQPSTSSTSTGPTQTAQTGPAPGVVTGGVSCGYGLTYGSPGGEGCFVFMLNDGNSTLTPTGTCTLTYAGVTYQGTFAYADPMAHGVSTGKVTCGESKEGPPAEAGTHVSGQVLFTNGQYADFNGTATS
jgi:hypothetical protein